MSNFHNTLSDLRRSYGYDSARQFYDHITNHGEHGFNYTYYVRMEKGSSLPASKTLQLLLPFFKKTDQDELIQSWCLEHFPKHTHLFSQDEKKLLNDKESESTNLKSQKALSTQQIQLLANSKYNYFIFLLITLARFKIEISKLYDSFPKLEVQKAIEQLSQHQIIHADENFISTQVVERLFPKPSTKDIRKLYDQFDLWDDELSQVFNFEKIITRKFVRRISYRHISLIQKHLELVFDLVRSSEEIDSQHNNHVLQLKLDLLCGQVPG